MSESPPEETFEARPSGEDPLEARNRLTMLWWLVPLLPLSIGAAIVISKLLT